MQQGREILTGHHAQLSSQCGLTPAFEFPEVWALGALSPGGEAGCSEPQAAGRGASVSSSRTPAAPGSVHVAVWLPAQLHPDVLAG